MPKFCPNCGHQAKDSAKFCSGCGGSFPVAPPSSYTPPAQAQGWSNFDSQEQQPGSGGYAPPQHWESYDYPSAPSGGGYTPPASNYQVPTYEPSMRADASRPLPPLSFDAPNAGGGSARDKARDIARSFSLWAAGIVLFPIPFSDLVLLMPIQTAMVISIGKAYGVKDPPEKTLAHIAAACGASVFGQITTLFVSNLIPIIGKLVSAPFVYGWTYGLGEVAIRYFESQGQIGTDEMKSLFKQVSKEATRGFKASDVKRAGESMDHLREHLSEEDYRKLRSRFGQS
jgi:uncharacterized protein (DUF697 family)